MKTYFIKLSSYTIILILQLASISGAAQDNAPMVDPNWIAVTGTRADVKNKRKANSKKEQTSEADRVRKQLKKKNWSINEIGTYRNQKVFLLGKPFMGEIGYFNPGMAPLFNAFSVAVQKNGNPMEYDEIELHTEGMQMRLFDVTLNGRFLNIIYSSRHRLTRRRLFLQKADVTDLSSMAPILAGNTPRGVRDFFVDNDFESNYMTVYSSGKIKEDEKWEFKSFDKNLDLISEKAIILGKEGSRIGDRKMEFDLSGNLLIFYDTYESGGFLNFGRFYEKNKENGKKYRLHSSHITQLDIHGNQKDVEMNLSQEWEFKGPRTNFIHEGLNVFGIIKPIQPRPADQSYLLFCKYDEQTLEEISRDSIALNFKLSRLKLHDAFLDEDKNLTVLFEERNHYSEIETIKNVRYSDGITRTNSMASIWDKDVDWIVESKEQHEHYDKSNVHVVKINPSGKILWATTIEKSQYSNQSFDSALFQFLIWKNNLYILYYETYLKKNFMIKVNANGEVESKSVQVAWEKKKIFIDEFLIDPEGDYFLLHGSMTSKRYPNEYLGRIPMW